MGSHFSFQQREQRQKSGDQKSLCGRDDLIEQGAEMQVSRIQRVVRGFLQRTRYQKVRQAAIQIQAEVRRYLAAFNLLALRSGIHVENGYRWALLGHCSAENNGQVRYELTTPESILHDGSFARTVKALHYPTQLQVAVRQYDFGKRGDQLKLRVANEICILRGLTDEGTHMNIISMIDCFYSDGTTSLVFELLDSDLSACVRTGSLSPTQVKKYLFQCCSGLAFCHARAFVHGSLRPEHLLLTKDGQLKISGFGRSPVLYDSSVHLTRNTSALWYRSPEALLGWHTASFSSDLWSVGVIFAEMASGHPLFSGRSQIDQLKRIFRQLGTPTEEIWPGVTELQDWDGSFPKWEKAPYESSLAKNLEPSGVELLDRFLAHNPENRLTAMESLDHPYFEDLFDDEKEEVTSPNCVMAVRKIY